MTLLPWNHPMEPLRRQMPMPTARNHLCTPEDAPQSFARERGVRGAIGSPAAGCFSRSVSTCRSKSRSHASAPLLCQDRLQVCPTTGVKLRGPEGAQRLRATSASMSELACCALRLDSFALCHRAGRPRTRASSTIPANACRHRYEATPGSTGPTSRIPEYRP
jgi:hypothetical protein